MLEIIERLEEVVEFNALCGRYDSPTKEDLLAQAKVVLEEAKEVLEAVNDTPEHLVKEVADLAVVSIGMIALLNRMGYDVNGAWKAVNANNMQKIIENYNDVCYTKAAYNATTDNVEALQVGANKWVIKDVNGKVRKPIGFVPLTDKDMKPFVPKEE